MFVLNSLMKHLKDYFLSYFNSSTELVTIEKSFIMYTKVTLSNNKVYNLCFYLFLLYTTLHSFC